MFAAAMKTPTGVILYYTGKSGTNYLAREEANAFFGFSEEGALRKAEQLCAPRRAGMCANYEPLAVPAHTESEGGHCD